MLLGIITLAYVISTASTIMGTANKYEVRPRDMAVTRIVHPGNRPPAGPAHQPLPDDEGLFNAHSQLPTRLQPTHAPAPFTNAPP